MAHARRAEPAIPQSASYFATAAFAAALLTLIVALALDPFGIRAPAGHPSPMSPALIESGQQWELQRLQQGGHVDPLLGSGRDWERQRRQQGGNLDPTIQSGIDWELQRQQQSAN
jgi:hypothetical protein